MSQNLFRLLPPVNTILEQSAIQALFRDYAHDLIVEITRTTLDNCRDQLKAGTISDAARLAPGTIADAVVAQVKRTTVPFLRHVINATGIVLHTNLGRSPMPEVAAQAAYRAARSYLNLELDLATGKRSSRQDPIRAALLPLLDAEWATVVNNCAAATVIVLRALALGKEVIVARGQLVEIGGSFRIPEIMQVSGATLKEVGTTNINRIGDYEKAIGPNTGLIMKIHHSNYRISGFTESATLEELVALGRKHNIPVIDDAGSGAMFDFARFGLPGDPVIPDSLKAGADLVLFSGDKLLGGPQAGIIAGKKELVRRIEKDPLMRAFRLDKMTLAALEATLRLYRNFEKALVDVPTLRLLGMPIEALQAKAEAFAERLRVLPGLKEVSCYRDQTFVGGGSLPDLPLPTQVIKLRANTLSAESFANNLRTHHPAVMSRVQDDAILLDLRTVFDSELDLLYDAIQAVICG